MYQIMDIVWDKAFTGLSKPFVHLFYKTMFMKLYGLDEKEAGDYIGKKGDVTYSCDFLFPLVKNVWEKHKECAAQFYDIRTSEEAGQPAPEYAILKKAGIRDISPVGIKGMGSMAYLMGLQIAECYAEEGKCALMLLAELEHNLGTPKENTACAFAIYPFSNTGNRRGIWITDYCMHLTADEMLNAVKDFQGTVIHSDTATDNIPAACSEAFSRGLGLTSPLLYLHRAYMEQRQTNVLSVHKAEDKYGLVYYQVITKEGKCQ